MEKVIEDEIRGLKADIKAKEEAVAYEQEQFAKALKNGLGEQMINTLSKPSKISRFRAFKIKLAQWLLK